MAGLILVTHGVTAGEWRVTPRLSLTETYTDNVGLDSDGSESSSLVTDVTAGVTVRGRGSRINLLGAYNIQQVFRTSGNVGDRRNQQWQLTSDLEWLKRIGFLNVRTTRRQENISNTGNTATSNINTGSRRNVTTVSVNPSIRHRFGDYADSSFQVGYNLVSNETGGDSSTSRTSTVTSTLSSGNYFARLPWRLQFNRRNVTNANDSESKFNTARASGSYVWSRRFSLDFGAGFDINEFSSSQESNEGFRWDVGGTWRPTGRTVLSVGVEQRFFNNENLSYFLDFSHTSRRTRWQARYREDITTSEREQIERDVIALVDEFGELIEDPDTGAPILIPTEFVVATDEVIVVRRFDANVRVTRRRGSISVNAFSRERDFQLTGDTETQLGAGVSLSHRMSRRLSANANFNGQFNERRGDAATEIRLSASAGLSYTISDWLSGSLRYRHTELFSEDDNAEFAENQLAARFNVRF